MATKNKQNYLIKVDYDLSSMLREIQNMKKQISAINAGKGFSDTFTKAFKEIEDKANKFSVAISQGFSSPKELDKMVVDLDKFSNLLTDVGTRLNKFEINDTELKDSNANIQKLTKSLRELDSQAKSAKEIVKETPIKLRDVSGTKTETKAFSRKVTSAAEMGDVAQVKEGTKTFLAYLDTKLQKLTDVKLIEDSEYENIKKQNKEAEGTLNNLKEQAKVIREMKKESRTSEQQGVLDTYSAAKKTEKTTTPQLQKFDLSTLAKQANEVEKTFIPIAQDVQAATEKVTNTFSKLNTETKKATDTATEGIQGLKAPIDNITSEVKGLETAAKGASDSTKSIDEVKARLEKAGNLMKRFFGLSVLTNLVKTAVRSIFSDFKKLDEQFNEIAIVSDYSTSEMWAGFDRINDMAQKYGVTATNVVSVQRLYYEQGLKTAEVNQLTAETLTLAKITGMEFKDATDQMTAAMRAFKIEAEDANLITDTFAALASGTAADAQEISNALNKTASIAASAGMSLQSTSVFLTKMIETTREAPENLGTAMKTIVARFGELKQNLSEIEVDGEIVDANKIDTALKTIGLSLRDTGGQFRDLDDVFMELSKKWDDLDRNTQRYIATTAAGSRQQSRFIAMMEDYDRTLELTTIAEDSAGTGKKQLEKSMQSIQTSLNNLTSAWQDFYTNLLKSSMFKWLIDSLTGIIGLLDSMNPVVLTLMATITAGLIPVIGKLISAFIISKLTMAQDIAAKQAGILSTMTATVAEEKGIIAKTALWVVTKLNSKAIAEEAAAKAALTLQEQINTLAESENITTSAAALIISEANAAAKLKEAGATGIVTVANKGETTSLWAKITAKIIEIGLTKLLVGLAIAAAVVVTALAIAHSAEAASLEKANEATEKSNEAISKNNEVKDKAVSSLITYNKALKLHEKGLARTSEEEETYQALLKTLSDTMPEMVDTQDDGTLALKRNQTALDDLIKLKEDELKRNNDIILSNSKLSASYGQILEGSPAEATAKRFYDTATGLSTAGAGTGQYTGIEEAAKLMSWADEEDIQKGLGEIGTGKFDLSTFETLTGEGIDTKDFQAFIKYFKDNGENADLKTALGEMGGEFSENTVKGILKLDETMDTYGTSLTEYLKTITSEQNLSYAKQTVSNSIIKTEFAKKGYTGEVPQEFIDSIANTVDTGFSVTNKEAKAEIIVKKSDGSGENDPDKTKTVNAKMFEEIVANSKDVEEVKQKIRDALGENGKYINFNETFVKELEEAKAYYERDISQELRDAIPKEVSNEEMEILNEIATDSKKDLWTEEEKTANLAKVAEILGEGTNVYTDFVSKLTDGTEGNQQKLLEEKNTLIKKIEAKGLTSINSLNLDTSQLQTISDFMDKLEDKGAKFGKDFSSIISNLGEEDKVRFFEQFQKSMTTDTSESINQLRALGKELGVPSQEVENLIKNFDEYSERTGFNFDSAVKQTTADVSQLQQAFDLLSNSEGLSAEDIQTLMAVDDSLSMSNFQLTTDGYKLIGTTTKEILKNKQAELKEQYLLNIADNESVILNYQREMALSATTAARKEELLVLIASLQNANALYRSTYNQIVNISTKVSESAQDAAKSARELLASLKDILDVYSNINAIVDDLSSKGSIIDAQLELTQNSEQKAKLIGEKLANSLNLTAAYSAINIAAEKNLQLYADSINENYSKYLTFDEDGNLIENYEAITELYKKQASAVAAGNEDGAEAIENQISNMKDQADGYREQRSLIDENNEALLEQISIQQELVNTQYENIKTLEDKIIEILQEQDEKELQMVEDKYNQIKEADQDYLESVQKVVDKERQIRDRANTQTSYQEKLKRLALLKMDTSGVYSKEILQLESELQAEAQEIADQRQDDLIAEEEEAAAYKAEKLDADYSAQEANLTASKELMTTYISEVNQLMLLGQGELMTWLQANDTEFITGTKASQYLWLQEWSANVANAKAGQVTLSSSLEPVQTALSNLTSTTWSLKSITQDYFDTVSLNKDGAVNSINNVAGAYSSLIGSIQEALTYQNALNTAMSSGGGKVTNPIASDISSDGESLINYVSANGDVEWQNIAGADYYYDKKNNVYLSKSDAYHNTGTKRNPESWVWEPNKGIEVYSQEEIDSMEFLYYNHSGGSRYANGGLVDYTGPAWVDGNKSNPEAFLDSQDTSNIFSLTQTLRALFNKTNTSVPTTASTETNTSKIEVNIQVGSLANDYDVDQLTTRVENNIVKASKKNTKITKVTK